MCAKDTVKQQSLKNATLPYFICSLASLFYVYDFIIRILPGTIANDLMLQYHTDAAGLGVLSSLFFLGYMLMQVPTGLLYDRFGPHRLLTITTLVAAIATYLFTATYHFEIAMSARFFMGVSAAFAYIGALVLASRWLPLKYYALMAGLIQLMGSLGAIIGQAPFARLVNNFGSYHVISGIAAVGVILAIAFALFIQDAPPQSNHHYQKNKIGEFTRLKNVLGNSQNWAAALYGFVIWAPIDTFASLWAIPFLRHLYPISNTHAASLASFLWLGVGLGGPFLGWLSNHLQLRRLPLLIASVIGILSSLMILYLPHVPINIMIILLFFFGVAGSAQAVTFGVVQDNNKIGYVGTAAGFNNMAIVLGGTLFQPLVGLLLRWHAGGKINDGIPIYSIFDFQYALFILPLSFIISFFTVWLLIRETHCESMRD